MTTFKIYLLFLYALLLTIISCSDEPTKPKEKELISLEIMDVSCGAVWMKVIVDTAYVGYHIRVNQLEYETGGGANLPPGVMTKTDTIVILRHYKNQPGETLSYEAAIAEGYGGKDLYKSKIITATLITPTSNDISWQVDTIGVFQTRLKGVWGSSPTDVYAVGWIRMPSDEKTYNIIHWNGWHSPGMLA